MQVFKFIVNMILLVALFFAGCYMADGEETLSNMDRKVKSHYHAVMERITFMKDLDEK